MRALFLAAAVAVLAGCSSRSTTCSCTRPDGGNDLIDIKGGSCSEFEGGQQGYTNCTPVVLFRTIFGPDEAREIAMPDSLPSLDRGWTLGG